VKKIKAATLKFHHFKTDIPSLFKGNAIDAIIEQLKGVNIRREIKWREKERSDMHATGPLSSLPSSLLHDSLKRQIIPQCFPLVKARV